MPYVEPDSTDLGPREGHTPECEVWTIPFWDHKPTICNTVRTFCDHAARHTYGQPCDSYNETFGAI